MTVTFRRSLVLIALLTLLPSPAAAQDDRFAAVPFRFDPGGTSLVQSGWLTGLGCPTDIVIAGVTYFLGCNSPAAPDVTAGDGWLRLR